MFLCREEVRISIEKGKGLKIIGPQRGEEKGTGKWKEKGEEKVTVTKSGDDGHHGRKRDPISEEPGGTLTLTASSSCGTTTIAAGGVQLGDAAGENDTIRVSLIP